MKMQLENNVNWLICVQTLKNDLILLENPLTVQIEQQNIELQQKLCDLQCDLSFKTLF